jgi:hypothetical protein
MSGKSTPPGGASNMGGASIMGGGGLAVAEPPPSLQGSFFGNIYYELNT